MRFPDPIYFENCYQQEVDSVLSKTFLYILYILSSTVETLLTFRNSTTVGKHHNEPKIFFAIHKAGNAP